MVDEHEALITVYSRDRRKVLTGISTMKYRTEQPPATLPERKAVYTSSQTVGGREVVYGSLLYIMDEAVKPIFRAQRLLRELKEAEPTKGRPSGEWTEVGENAWSQELLPGDDTDVILYRQEQILKDALLLTGIHVRTLLEDFSGRGNVSIPIYDRAGSYAGTVSLAEVFNTLAHYRYCVVSGAFIHDVFSGRGQLGSSELVGTKMKTNEVFDAVLEFISRIRVRDFVGVLRGRLESLSIHSERRDAIFAVQNVHAVGRVIHERVTENGAAPQFMSFLKSKLAEWKGQTPQKTEAVAEYATHWTERYGIPNFQIWATLCLRLIEVDVSLGGEREMFVIGWDEFFGELVRIHGDEPLVHSGVLKSRFESMDSLGR